MTSAGIRLAYVVRRSTTCPGGYAANASRASATIRSTAGRICSVRRAVNALAVSLRSLVCSAPYALTMLSKVTQPINGQSGGISPLRRAGQCWRAFLDTRGSVSSWRISV